MAVTIEYSTQAGRELNGVAGWNAKIDGPTGEKLMAFDFTQGAAAGDATSKQYLRHIPAGVGRVTGIYIVGALFGASRVLDIGHGGFTKQDGTVVAADAEAFKADLDVSAATATLLTLNFTYDARSGFDLVCAVAGGTIPIGTTLKGWIRYCD